LGRTSATEYCSPGTRYCASTGPVNLGNPGEFTIEELADLVIELTGTASPVERLPLPADDPVRRQPDITLAKKILGWQPTVELREGLLRTIDYFRSSDSAFMAPAIAAARRDDSAASDLTARSR
jgi:UDP-glucuronate decarboxylase